MFVHRPLLREWVCHLVTGIMSAHAACLTGQRAGEEDEGEYLDTTSSNEDRWRQMDQKAFREILVERGLSSVLPSPPTAQQDPTVGRHAGNQW